MSEQDREEAFFAEGPAVEPGPHFPDGEGACEVVLAEHPHPLCRMRTLIGLARGTEMRVFEIEGARKVSLVDLLLGRASPSLNVRRAEDFDALVVLRSFPVAENSVSAVVTAAHRYLTARTPGLLPVAQTMSNFHAADGVFEALRAAAGSPPVRMNRLRAVGEHPSLRTLGALPIRRPAARSEGGER